MFKTIIASACRAHRTPEHNLVNHKEAYRILTDVLGLQPTCCIGSYREEGQNSASVEASIYIPCETIEEVDSVLNLFFVQFQQEAVLTIEPGNQAVMVFPKGTAQHIGEFREVSQAVALASECYTYLNGHYFQALEAAPAWGDCSESTKQAESEALHDADKPQFNNDPRYDAYTISGNLPGEGRKNH